MCLMLCFVWVYVDFCRFIRCASADPVYMCGLKGKLIHLFVLEQVDCCLLSNQLSMGCFSILIGPFSLHLSLTTNLIVRSLQNLRQFVCNIFHYLGFNLNISSLLCFPPCFFIAPTHYLVPACCLLNPSAFHDDNRSSTTATSYYLQ